MSDARSFSVRWVWPVFAALVLGGVALAEEESRTWTNSKGKTVTGTLQEKGDDWVKILIKGKVHKLSIASLSETDQTYIKNAKLDGDPAPDEPKPKPETEPEPEPEPDEPKPKDETKPSDDPKPKDPGAVGDVVGLKVSEVDPAPGATVDKTYSAQRLKFEVTGVGEEGVHCIMVWVAHFRGGGGLDAHSSAEDFFAKDGEYYLQELFQNDPQSGASYKGYAVRLLNPKKEKVAEMVSEPKYAKFLDDAQRRIFPGSIPEAAEEKK